MCIRDSDKTEKLKIAESKLHDAEQQKAELEAKAHEAEQKKMCIRDRSYLVISIYIYCYCVI